MTEAEKAIETIETFVTSCFLSNNCGRCPFYVEGKNIYASKCMGPDKYGKLLMAMLDDIKGERKNGKKKNRTNSGR